MIVPYQTICWVRHATENYFKIDGQSKVQVQGQEHSVVKVGECKEVPESPQAIEQAQLPGWAQIQDKKQDQDCFEDPGQRMMSTTKD